MHFSDKSTDTSIFLRVATAMQRTVFSNFEESTTIFPYVHASMSQHNMSKSLAPPYMKQSIAVADGSATADLKKCQQVFNLHRFTK